MNLPRAGPLDPGLAHRYLWVVLLLLQGSLFMFAIGDRRAVPEGATRECLLLQQAALTGASDGPARVDRTSYFAQDGLLQQVLLLAPGVSARVDGRTWFYLGLLIDELLLLVGVWLLARSLFSDLRAVFVVGVAAIGSSLWIDQVWSNFRSFHALPLLLHLVRAYRSSGSPLLLAAALNLAGLQAMGKPPAQGLLAPLAALLAMLLFRGVLDPTPSSNPSPRGRWAAAAAGIVSWIPVAILASGGPAASTVPRPFLETVLDFCSAGNPGTWLDAAMGIAPAPDFTLYCGFFTLGLAILGIARSDRRTVLRGAGAVLLLMLALGLASAILERMLPSVHSPRSATGAPLLRLLLVLLAGAGFERLLQRPAVSHRAALRVGFALLLVGLALFLTSIRLERSNTLAEVAARFFVPRAPAGTISPLFGNLPVIRELFDISAVWALVAGGVILLAGAGARTAPLAITLLLFLHPLDVFGWKFRMTWIRTEPPPREASVGRLSKREAPPEELRRFLRPDRPGAKVAAGILGAEALLWIVGLLAAAAGMTVAYGSRTSPMPRPDPRRDCPATPSPTALERRLFAVLLALLGVYYLWIYGSRRIPSGHDSFYVLMLQNLFLSQSPGEGQLLHWFPYSMHGILSSWYVSAGGWTHAAAVGLGVVPEGTNAVPLFHAGMLVEDLVLLIGTWRLSRFFLRTPSARFLVVVGVVGASFWAQQMWHNHRPSFAIPLILAFFHEFFEDGRRIRAFLGLNLLFLQFLGNLPYVAVMIHLVVGAYLAVYVLVYRRSLRSRWEILRPRAADAAWIAANLAVLGCLYLTLTHGTREISLHASGRSAEGAVSLSQYLRYPGEVDPVRYGDLLFGISPSTDYTIFCGIGAVPLALLAFAARPGRKVLLLSVFLFLLFLLSLGYLSAVGMPAYLLPPFRFFRYITLTAPFVRLPLILLAGIGFETLMTAARRDPARSRRVAVAFGVLAAGCGLFALAYAFGLEDPFDLPRLFITPSPGLANYDGLTKSGLATSFGSAAAAAIAAAIALLALASRPGRHRAVTAMLLVIFAGDIARWRTMITLDRTISLEEAQYRLLETRPLPYVPRRSLDFADPSRARSIAVPTGYEHAIARYDTMENYLHRDPPVSPFTTSHFMTPVRRLLLAYDGRRLDADTKDVLVGWKSRRGRPLRPPYDKIIGESVDKLQVFSAAHVVATDQETADLLNRPEFTGDSLLLAPLHPGLASSPGPFPPRENQRVDAAVDVVSFDANHLRAKVTLPAGTPTGWLLYCDAWHSDWTATVNGKDVPVARAFLAYKAVPLDAGASVVEFRMRSAVRVWTFRLAALNAGLWVAGILVLTVAALRPRKASAVRAASAGA